MGTYVNWCDVPVDARNILAEVYDAAGIETFWNSYNKVLHGKPRDLDLELVIAHAKRLADGNFA